MSAEITADAPLDYVTFQILQENRYNAFVTSSEKENMVGHGLLDQVLDHLPNIKDQLANEPCDNVKLKLPDNIDKRAWFTKATLTRFLRIVGSPELEKSVNISNEISQLAEARKFHLSLYAKAEDGITSSDNSKNELLRAMDTRIAALMEELASTFNSVAGGTFSCQEMVNLQHFCQQFADADVRNLLSNLPETGHKDQTVVPSENKSPIPFISRDDYINKPGGANQISGSYSSDEVVKYNASPDRAAEIDRQSSTEIEDSSFSSEDEQPSVERSRTFVRYASPRRSASPMRRIQVGRSGPRRTPALTIKSLTCFPARERISAHKETEKDCQPGGSEEPDKKTEVNVTRISVQDAISLFENKQKNQTVDTQNWRSIVDTSTNTNKTVLRRWSSGMGESPQSVNQTPSKQTASEDNSELVDQDARRSEEVKPEKDPVSENPVLENAEVDVESEMSEKGANRNSNNAPESEAEFTRAKLDSDEWSRQKEEELNQILMKFAEHNQINPKNAEPDSSNAELDQTNLKNAEPDSSKNCKSRIVRRSGNYGQYKEKKDDKLKGESSGKRAEKQSGFRAKKNKIQEKQEGESSSVKVSDVGKKQPTGRTQNVKKTEPVALNSKKESLKAAEPKKISSKKSSPLPAVRKSWPSTPSLRGTGTLPEKVQARAPSSRTKAPPQKSQAPAPREKPQSQGPQSWPSPKLERSQIQHKDVKSPQVETKKSSKKVEDGKNQVVPKGEKSTKIDPVMAHKEETRSKKKRSVTPEEKASRSPAKVVGCKRVTKKSSVVPLGAKPSPSKDSDMVQLIEGDPTNTTPGQVEETLSKCEDPINNVLKNAGATIPDTVHLVEQDPVLETHNGHVELEREIDVGEPNDGGERETSNEITSEADEIAEKMPESPAEIHPVQELLISPAAWEESSHQDPSDSTVNSCIQSPPNHDTLASPETRVRHSLSQMLLEEISEPDVIEWGNAENPPTMVYQKDAPKGLKRLLKFTRKNKGETNGAAGASPYTSEGEDDGEEYKTLAQSNTTTRSARTTNKFQEGHGTTKGTRSFFSLSAFRGNRS